MTAFDVEAVRAQFPILNQTINDHPLVYLDNAATTQKPESVIEAVANYYRWDNANVHRGAHALSDRATARFEAARAAVGGFINSPAPEQVIWTRGTTEGINLVASSWGGANLGPGDRVLVSAMEHHSNIVPWQMVAERTGAELHVIPVDDTGTLDMSALDQMLDERVKMVAVGHVSNALGSINPIERIIERAHAVGARVLIDAAQSVAHWPLDVTALDCDFLVFSAHKMFGPTGIGALFGKRDLLEAMPPYHGGGEMIESVSFEGTVYQSALPFRFEAGTPNMAGVIGFGAAVEFVQGLDRDGADAHEKRLLDQAQKGLEALGGFRLVGTSAQKTAVMSFVSDVGHAQDIGMILDQQGIAVRTGHHCAQPIVDQYGLPGTVRASFSIYNTSEEVDRLLAGLEKVKFFLA